MGESILIVEDEKRMRNLLYDYFKKEGFNILQGENGVEALKILRKKTTVDIVLLDIMMPYMDGWTLCKEIRKENNVPIIILTAKSEEEDKLLGYELGADDYVTKPFSPKILVAKTKALLKRVYTIKEKKEDILEFDGLSINKLSHEVTIGDKEIYLSPKEYELLLFLSENKDIVLTRDRILDGVWGIDYYGDVRTVDTHIKRLREKLGKKAKVITTIRGTGYKFEVK